MDQESIKGVIDTWGLKGLGLGMMIGFVFEVFFIRTYTGKVKWTVSILSIAAMGMMGWISYDIAYSALPTSAWKPSVWATGATANTWIITRLVTSGQLFQAAAKILMPKALRQALDMEVQDAEDKSRHV